MGFVNGLEVLEKFGPTWDGLLKFKAYWVNIQENPEQKAKPGFKLTRRLCKRIQLQESFPERRVFDAYKYPQVKV